jgi:hypothetical protein
MSSINNTFQLLFDAWMVVPIVDQAFTKLGIFSKAAELSRDVFGESEVSLRLSPSAQRELWYPRPIRN